MYRFEENKCKNVGNVIIKVYLCSLEIYSLLNKY